MSYQNFFVKPPSNSKRPKPPQGSNGMSERATSVDKKLSPREILLLARPKYPEWFLMVTPLPHKVGTETYLLQWRPKVTKNIADFDWQTLASGTLEQLLAFVQAAEAETGAATRSYVGQ